ncbi:hypothetical protein AK830_g3071 [Neonectria ditissima]|uniref:Uncharacterized protein n=1 Tax=Neonectria ditissima TaxID=78410 RepID=A0A0P7BT25_9HYPO|nr:hypothetical protein AK830_g3071 [Neonectria ditissima]
MSRHVRARQICTQLLRGSSTTSPPAALTLLNSRVVLQEQPFSRGEYQIRSYAAPRAPRVRKGGTSYAEVYTLEGITVGTFEEAVKMSGMFEALSVPQYYEIAQRFAEAIKHGSSPWSVRLLGQNRLSHKDLYEVGCIMRHIREPRSSQAFAVAMWASAAEMGSRPATISLARQLIHSHAWGQKSQLRSVEARFKQLVSEGKDPNVLTVEGEHLYELGKYDAAANMLRRALALDEKDFEWKSQCQLHLGKAYLKLKRPAEAREVFETISESGSAEADVELGQLLRSSDTEKAEQHLYTAAINGKPEMFHHLSEIAFENMNKAADEQTRKDQQRWAMEWSRLADPKVQF